MELVQIFTLAVTLANTYLLVSLLRKAGEELTVELLPFEFVEALPEEKEAPQPEPEPVLETAQPVPAANTSAWVNRKGIPLVESTKKPEPPIQKDPNDRPYGWV